MNTFNTQAINRWLFVGTVALLAGFASFFTSTHAAHAMNAYYISPSGSDSNACSSSAPCATINHVDSILAVGSGGTCTAASGWSSTSGIGACVHVAAGTYNESQLSCNGSGRVTGVCLVKSGSASARIQYISDAYWGAHVVGPSVSANTEGDDWLVLGSYVDVKGFDITSAVQNAINLGLRFDGTNGRGLNNHIHNIYNNNCNGTTGDGGAGLQPDPNSGPTLLQGNVIHDIGPYATGGCNNVHGIYISGQQASVYNNIVYHSSSWGIEMYHNIGIEAVSDNLVFGNGTPGYGGGVDFETAVHSTVSNNIIRDNANGNGIYCPGADSTSLVANNLLFNNSLSCGDTLSGNKTATDPKQVNFNLNPAVPTISSNVVTFSNADYHLTSGSPAIDTGTTACTSGGISPCVPNVDLDNISRPQGTAYDIGAYEYGGTSTSLPTISSFSASPTSITSGQTATLSWTTSGATSASITNVGSVAVSGSATVSPTTTTTYTLTATNSAGSVTQSVTITVASSSGGPAGYTFCANEGGTCSFTGTMSVAYGANGLFFYQTLTEPGWNGACNNTTFGDPDFGVVKACYTQAIASAVSVSISPTSATLASGGQQQFTATVSNCGTNCGVTWSASQGSITSGGLFTAPTVSVSTIVTVVATSQADTTKSASASVTVNPGTATYSFWSNSYVPSGSYTTDNSVENGIRFHSTTNGYVTGIRFYKGSSSDNGTHLGHLWNASGSLLASATFTNETASGWQTVSFSQPVAVSANTDYVASEFTSSGYVYVPNFFNSSFSSGPLIAPATSASTPNGTYIYSATGAFPTQTYSGTNYWVDVVFTPSTTTVSAPSITSSLSSSATINQSYSYQITASNSPTSYGASNLPAGLTVNTANGLISGTPTTAGTYSITLSATNSGGTGSATLTLTVGSGGGTIQTGGAFDINDRMTVTCNVKVRATPGGTQISVEQTGSKGTVIGGPVDSGARWWQINYDNGVSGWSSQGTGCLWKYFTSGERILVQNGPLNVRSAAGTASTILGTQASGALGTITGGPTYLNGYQWWNINYDTNPLGWSAANSWGQSYLTAAQ